MARPKKQRSLAEQLTTAIKSSNWTVANSIFARLMVEKVEVKLTEEKRTMFIEGDDREVKNGLVTKERTVPKGAKCDHCGSTNLSVSQGSGNLACRACGSYTPWSKYANKITEAYDFDKTFTFKNGITVLADTNGPIRFPSHAAADKVAAQVRLRHDKEATSYRDPFMVGRFYVQYPSLYIRTNAMFDHSWVENPLLVKSKIWKYAIHTGPGQQVKHFADKFRKAGYEVVEGTERIIVSCPDKGDGWGSISAIRAACDEVGGFTDKDIAAAKLLNPNKPVSESRVMMYGGIHDVCDVCGEDPAKYRWRDKQGNIVGAACSKHKDEVYKKALAKAQADQKGKK